MTPDSTPQLQALVPMKSSAKIDTGFPGGTSFGSEAIFRGGSQPQPISRQHGSSLIRTLTQRVGGRLCLHLNPTVLHPAVGIWAHHTTSLNLSASNKDIGSTSQSWLLCPHPPRPRLPTRTLNLSSESLAWPHGPHTQHGAWPTAASWCLRIIN